MVFWFLSICHRLFYYPQMNWNCLFSCTLLHCRPFAVATLSTGLCLHWVFEKWVCSPESRGRLWWMQRPRGTEMLMCCSASEGSGGPQTVWSLSWFFFFLLFFTIISMWLKRGGKKSILFRIQSRKPRQLLGCDHLFALCNPKLEKESVRCEHDDACRHFCEYVMCACCAHLTLSVVKHAYTMRSCLSGISSSHRVWID